MFLFESTFLIYLNIRKLQKPKKNSNLFEMHFSLMCFKFDSNTLRRNFQSKWYISLWPLRYYATRTFSWQHWTAQKWRWFWRNDDYITTAEFPATTIKFFFLISIYITCHMVFSSKGPSCFIYINKVMRLSMTQETLHSLVNVDETMC